MFGFWVLDRINRINRIDRIYRNGECRNTDVGADRSSNPKTEEFPVLDSHFIEILNPEITNEKLSR